MKYMQNGGFQYNPLMKLTIGLTLVFLSGLWVTNLLLYTNKMSLTPASVVSYYRGSEADFTVPRTYQSMLEVTHFHLPMMAMVILLLTHLLIFAPFKTRTKVLFIVVAFLSGFMNEGSGWLVRFVNPYFAYLKIACFLTFQAVMLFLIVALALFLWKSPSRKQKHAGSHSS
jgi:hypothetical protein